jgi:hypothetical protein
MKAEELGNWGPELLSLRLSLKNLWVEAFPSRSTGGKPAVKNTMNKNKSYDGAPKLQTALGAPFGAHGSRL